MGDFIPDLPGVRTTDAWLRDNQINQQIQTAQQYYDANGRYHPNGAPGTELRLRNDQAEASRQAVLDDQRRRQQAENARADANRRAREEAFRNSNRVTSRTPPWESNPNWASQQQSRPAIQLRETTPGSGIFERRPQQLTGTGLSLPRGVQPQAGGIGQTVTAARGMPMPKTAAPPIGPVGGGVGAQVAIGVAQQLAAPLVNRAAEETVNGLVIPAVVAAIGTDWMGPNGLKTFCSRFPLHPDCVSAPTDLPAEAAVGGAIPSATEVIEGIPPFTGGQSVGVRYRVFVYGQFRVSPYPNGETSVYELNGPIGGITQAGAVYGGIPSRDWFIPHGGTPGYSNPYQFASTFNEIRASNLPEFPNPSPNPGGFAITNVERVDGQQDTGGNPVGPPTQVPATGGPRVVPAGIGAPPNATPLFLPGGTQLGPPPLPANIPTGADAPPAPGPAPGSLPEPPDQAATGNPQISPDGNATGEPAPSASESNVPDPIKATGPFIVRQNGEITQSGDRVVLGEEIRSSTVIDRSGQQQEDPGLGPTPLPKIIQGLGGAALVGLSIRDPTTPGRFTNPLPPTTPPPTAPPTDTPCRCNAPVMNKLDDLDRKLGLLGAGGEAVSTAAILDKLNRMQQFAEKAWQGTRVQKAIDVLTLTTSLHNAYYLSRDVGATIGEMLSLVLDVVGIDDEAGNALDINTMVGNAVRNAINAALGEQLATNIGNALTRASRIYQSASNVIWTLRSLNDSTTDLLEITANNTGKIGNALKASKVVDALSYPYFSENYRAGDTMRRRTQQILDGIEQVDDTVGTLYAATASVRDIQEEIGALRTAKNQFAAEIGSLAPRDDVPENEPVADAANEAIADSQAPDANPSDLDPADASP